MRISSDLPRPKSFLQSIMETFRASPTPSSSTTFSSPASSTPTPASPCSPTAMAFPSTAPSQGGFYAPATTPKQVERTPSEASNVSLQSAVSTVYEGDDGARDSHHMALTGSGAGAGSGPRGMHIGSSQSCPAIPISPSLSAYSSPSSSSASASPSPRLPTQRLASLTPPNTPPLESTAPTSSASSSSSSSSAFGLDFKKITDFFTLFTSKSMPSFGGLNSNGKRAARPEPVVIEQASASTKAPQEFVNHIFDEHKSSHAILYSRYDDPYENETASNPLAKEITMPKPRNTSYRWYPNVRNNKMDTSSPILDERFSLDLSQPPATPSSTFRANAPEFLKKFNMAERHKEPATGDVIGGYRLGEVVGIGAFSSVREGYSVTDPQAKVAIKISEKDACDQSLLVQMQKELALWGGLEHPNLVKLYEQIESPSHTFTVCELCEEGSMYDLVINTPEGFLSEDEAKPYFAQIIQGLQYLHARDIFHGDVKLDNVLVAKGGNVKLCDFGFSECVKDRGEHFEGRACGGTLLYCAPEILRGSAEVGLPCDIWSAGVTLFAMLTGELPFDDDYEPRLKHQILAGKFCFPADIELSSEVKDLITSLLKTKTTERPTVQQILSHPWLRGTV